MNIIDYYRKYMEKSRSFYREHLVGRRIDVFLVIAAAVVLIIIAVNRQTNEVNNASRMSIAVSSQCEAFFGKEIISALIQEFEEQYPDLQVQMTTQENADIVFFGDAGLNNLIYNKNLASLSPYLSTEARTGHWAAHWALPLVSFMDIFLYNIDLLQAANCDRPPKTRMEFLATARAVAEKNPPIPWQETISVFALGLDVNDPMALRRDIYPWIWAEGGEIYSSGTEDGTLSRAAMNTISFFGQLDSEGLLAPRSFEKTGAQRLEEFAKGKIAMMTASAQSIDFLRRNAPGVNFGITAIPATTHGKNRLGLSGIYAGISGGCSYLDEAWTFVAFTARKSHVFAQALDAVPGIFSSAFPGEYVENDILYSKAWDIFEAAEIVEYHPDYHSEETLGRIVREKLAEALKK